MRVDLPGGQWAELRDPDSITERQRRPLMRAMGRLTKTEDSDDGGATAMGEVQSALIVTFVASWSYLHPVTEDSLLDLPVKAFDTLADECQPLMKDVLPNFAPSPDPASPTQPSAA